MIQRLQSIFFLLTGLCFGGEYLTEFATTPVSTAGIFSDMVFNVHDHIGLQILAGLGALLSIIAIFLYKNRENQIKLGYFIALVAIVLPAVAVLIFINQKDQIGDISSINQSFGLYLPLGMILFSAMAVKYIKKDQNLVQSMDRLR
jgi:hypothetical protein